jgi:leucyl/phenylalanyl-tRNA--protein transferase
MHAAYSHLHEQGWVHSVEVWAGGALAGGIYGVAIGGLFAAESMFHRARDASKVALAELVEHLRTRGFVLFDVQLQTPHLASLGVIEIARDEYLERLAVALARPTTFEA